MAKKSRITTRQKREKALLIEQLRKTPIIAVACKKAGIARATYYRWYQEDSQFESDSDEALRDGLMLTNDMVESKLLSQIQNDNLTAMIFWLKHRHLAYKTKNQYKNLIIVNGAVVRPEKSLTEEELKEIDAALKEFGIEPQVDKRFKA